MLSNVSLSMDLESPVAEVVHGSKTLSSTFSRPCWKLSLERTFVGHECARSCQTQGFQT